MLNKIKKIFWKTEDMDFTDSPDNSAGEFKLMYNHTVVGSLIYNGKEWTFQYSTEFEKDRLSTIIDFPNSNKIYKSDTLWPFFAARIPALNQPYQLKKIKRFNVDSKNSLELLKLFGKRTVANPFVLIFK